MRVLKNNRFYRWTESENQMYIQEVKVVRIQNEYTCSIVVTKGENIGERKKIKIDELESEYIKLKPDGYISFDIVQVGGKLQDVMVVLSRDSDIKAGSQLPYAICRQCVVDLFSKQLNPDEVEYVGLSVSQESCPADVNFENFFACNGIVKDETVAYYIGDRLADLFPLLSHTNDFNRILMDLFNDHCMYLAGNNKFIADTYKDKSDVDGYCKTLYQLLEMNNFEYDIYRAFNIIPTTFDKEHFSDQTLSIEASQVISQLLCVQLNKAIVVPYDKDINLADIKRDYCLVSDKDGTIYVVAYTVSGRYHASINESDDNIEKLQSMLNTESVQLAYQHLQFRKEKYNK